VTLLRGAEIDRFLGAPKADRPVVLLFGPDTGAVAERASNLVQTLVGNDQLAVARFEESDLADTGRLAEEAYAGSLFGGRRVIRIRAGGNRSIAGALKTILDEPPEDVWIVIEAGDLRKTAPLRKLCETAPRAAAIGCYPDNDAALGRLIDAEVKTAGLTIEPEARAALISLLGSDRAASRSEIQKLCLYAKSAGAITAADIAATVGDGAAFAIDDVVDAAALGDSSGIDRGFRRLVAAGSAASTIGTAAERHFLQLHRIRAAIDRGQALSSALQAVRPPLFPSRRESIERQVRLWSLEDLNDALSRLNQAMIDSRLNPAIGPALIERCLFGIALRAARSRRRSAA
jgi:DNA polymerase-3 subunit delta